MNETEISEQGGLTGYPSIDRPWLKYYSEKILSKKLSACTVYQNIYENNKENLADTAILYFGHKISYRELFVNVAVCAKALKQIGIKKGDCVTLCTAGTPEAIYLVLACSRIGAIANFINPLFSAQQMADRINDTESTWMFVLDVMYDYVKQALSQTCVRNVVMMSVTNSMSYLAGKIAGLKFHRSVTLPDGCRLVTWKEFCRFAGDFDNGAVKDSASNDTKANKIGIPYEKGLPAIMVYSSGTTGASKGILLTNDGINATIANYDTPAFEYERGDTFLQMIPVWFSTGIVLSVLMPLRMGITVIPELKFAKETFVEDLKKFRPNMTLAATSLWLYAVSSEKLANADLSQMYYPALGGEKVLASDEKNINQFLKEHGCTSEIIKGYGMCELGSTIATTTRASGYIGKPGGTGYPMLQVVVGIFDLQTDQELPYGEHGEIRVLSPARMKGYYKNPSATNHFFKTDQDGNVWGCTGDIGYMDTDGEIFVLGRATDLAVLESGRSVYLFDIEEVILCNEAVEGCKVVDVKKDGKMHLIAHIIVRQEMREKAEKILSEIYKSCVEKLPEDTVPYGFKVVESFPVHANGKRDVEAMMRDMEFTVFEE